MTSFPVVLAVDDSQDDILLLQMAFRKAGQDVALHVVTSAHEALAFLRRGKELPDLLILDLSMPGMSGFELLEKIREEPGLIHLTIVIFSSSQREEDIRRAYQGGADGYLMKPLDFAELVEVAAAIGDCLAGHERRWRLLQNLPCYQCREHDAQIG